jgi:hypothetical protein
MNEYVVIAIAATAAFVFVLARLYLKTLVKTSVQESIKHEFEVQRQQMRQESEREQSALERKDKYRLAALDERLAAHQEAYAFSYKLIRTLELSENEKEQTSFEGRRFWETKCLYLNNDVRKAFWESLIAYFFWAHDMSWKSELKTEEENEKEINLRKSRTREQLSKLPEIIAQAVDLEAIANEGQPSAREGIKPPP